MLALPTARTGAEQAIRTLSGMAIWTGRLCEDLAPRRTKMRGRQCARLQRVESGRARAGRAAYLVGWTKPLRRALGVIGEVGGGGSTARKGNDDAGGTRSGVEG